MPPPMSMTATPISFSSSLRTASALASGCEHDVGDREAAALGAADDVLHAARRRGDEVHLHAEAHARHPDGVADAVLAVDHVLARQDVEDLAVGVDRDGARALEHALDVAARDLAAGDGRDAVATPSERMWLPPMPA